MTNLQKFNETLDDLGQEVQQLKEVSTIYKNMQRQAETFNTILNQFKENNKTLGEISVLQKTHLEKVTKSLNEIENINKQDNARLIKLMEEKTDQIRKENKEFYKDLESSIKIKLDENNFKIKQLIENERNLIKQIFELEFAKNTKELNSKIEKETVIQTKLLVNNQTTIKRSIWIIGFIVLILIGLCAFRLWIL